MQKTILSKERDSDFFFGSINSLFFATFELVQKFLGVMQRLLQLCYIIFSCTFLSVVAYSRRCFAAFLNSNVLCLGINESDEDLSENEAESDDDADEKLSEVEVEAKVCVVVVFKVSSRDVAGGLASKL